MVKFKDDFEFSNFNSVGHKLNGNCLKNLSNIHNIIFKIY
jgi:hypothetical protein